MICGCGLNHYISGSKPIPNKSRLAYHLFTKALEVGVLSACGHTGLIDKGMEHFYSMTRDYGIVTNTRQYTCIIDLLGRAGCLDDARNLMIDMSCEPDVATWATLQGASRIHGTPN
ncbi:hypothetical protein H5410_018742 [Solanum commersonii]|uniref:Pentatricopeptide repeat-containing protein n=1 Tax=Solanum commersonii TaxID=4109 RepID=A0A9J6A2T2_SOLCO|nr:hypothetical protein H5410_018742 [Solanum commersonii]